MVKILAIGNSFSVDATRYLYRIAEADGTQIKVYNAQIGGCPLSKHFRMMRRDEAAYDFQFNGESTGIQVSLKQVLSADDWDYVTLQQLSQLAPKVETYQPYLNELAAYVRYYVPNAKLLMHQTWAYEQGSARLCSELGYTDQADMFRDIKAAYQQAAKAIGAAGIIPSGELFQRMLQNGFAQVHRDTFHAHLGYGRYALASLWYDLLCGHTAVGNSFRKLDVPSDGVDFALIQKLAHETADDYRF